MKHIDKDDYCCDNTFAPDFDNKTFTYRLLLGALRLSMGMMRWDSLPHDVQLKMSAYLKQQYDESKRVILNDI